MKGCHSAEEMAGIYGNHSNCQNDKRQQTYLDKHPVTRVEFEVVWSSDDEVGYVAREQDSFLDDGLVGPGVNESVDLLQHPDRADSHEPVPEQRGVQQQHNVGAV